MPQDINGTWHDCSSLAEYYTDIKFENDFISLPEDYYLNIIRYYVQLKKEAKTKKNRCTSILQSLEGKTVNMTVLNIDVVNSTEKVRMLSGGAAGEYYRAFIKSTSDLIQDYGGCILKNMGDCVLGFFPSGKCFTENHDSAVSCGLAIISMMDDSLNPYFKERSLPSIACRISADFGPARVLRIRSNGDYSAIDLFGTVLNSASKILPYAKPDQMVIGDNLFWELVHNDGFKFKLIKRFSLTGNHTYPVYLVERAN